ncbi:MAG TPA: hypothetical protein VN231_07560 [Allosphingosinicella sp.]|nr:hypothetical protein [Allosphingosinicella sp.]
MAKSEFDFKHLSPTEQSVVESVCGGLAFSSGWWFEFNSDGSDEDPLELAAFHADNKKPLEEAPSIRAELLRHLLTGLVDEWPRPVQGVQVSGLRITGPLSLEYGRRKDGGPLPALICNHCHFSDRIKIEHAHLEGLDFSNSIFPSLDAELVKVSGAVGLWNVVLTSAGPALVNLAWADVGGLLSASGLSAGPEVEEIKIYLFQAKVRGVCSFHKAGHLTSRTIPLNLSIFESKFASDLDLSHTVFGTISAQNVEIASTLSLTDSRIESGANFSSAQLHGILQASRLDCPAGSNGLTLDELQLDGVWLMHDATIHGGIKMVGVRCKGGWEIQGTRIFAKSEGEGRGWAIAAREARFGGSVQMRKLHAQGLIGLARAHIDGNFDLRGAILTPTDTGAETSDGQSLFDCLFAPALGVAGDMRLGTSPSGQSGQFDGVLILDGSTIEGDLELSGASLLPRPGDERIMSLRNARVGGHLAVCGFAPDRMTEGIVDLTGAVVGVLDDRNGEGWGQHPQDRAETKSPGVRLRLNGFVYHRLHEEEGRAASLWPGRRRWLDRQDYGVETRHIFYPQPYDYLTKLLRADGHEQDARRVAIAKRAKRRHAGEASFFDWLLSLLYQITFGYGCSPVRATGTLLAYWVIGSLWLSYANRLGVITVAKDGARERVGAACLDFSPGLHALELMVPLPNVSGGACAVDSAAVAWKVAEVAYALGGAIVLALALITFSGVARHELNR